MHKPGNGAQWSIAVAILALLAVLTLWRSAEPPTTKDYEDCIEEAKAETSSGTENNKLTTQCDERFAGRRKPGGGYAYFDFMQNRTFDIAGPNPTEDERRQIDRAYVDFLTTQSKEIPSSVLAKALSDKERATLARKDAGPPFGPVTENPAST